MMVRCEIPDSRPHDGRRIIPDYPVPRQHHQPFRDRLGHEQSVEGIFVQGGQGERTGCVIDRDGERIETIGREQRERWVLAAWMLMVFMNSGQD